MNPETARNWPAMSDKWTSNWYPTERVLKVTGMSERTFRRRLSDVPSNCIRPAESTGGRPRHDYHFSAFPELAVHHRQSAEDPSLPSRPSVQTPSDYAINPPPAPAAPKPGEGGPKPPPKPKGAAKDDLVRAELRLLAVREYEERRKLMTADEAAVATCRDWATWPRVRTVTTSERLPGGHARMTRQDVDLGIFKPGTLRTWSGTYARTQDVLSLADRKKGNVGRKRMEIPERLLSYIYGLSVSTARADVTKAVQWAKGHWPSLSVDSASSVVAFPDLSIDTWRRAIKAFDPRKAGKDLNHSLQRFRANHSGDVEVNWDLLPYNGRFEVDDVQQDWYGLASDMERFVRPFAYAVSRTRTRQWVAFVSSEAPITDDQVAELLGFTMASSSGGIPDEWKLENRNVTVRGGLVEILESLSCKVAHTSMDGGEPVFGGAVPDGSEGHPQGHGVHERMNRDMHDRAWNAPGQVGGDERNTAPSRTEAWLRMARDAQKRGEFVLVHGPEQWAARQKAVCEQHNASPCSGLQQIVDPDTGEIRHMTPNECAMMLKAHEVRVMKHELLPLFASRGVDVPVTRNGIRVNNRSYGRFDEELKMHAAVKAFVSDVAPDVAYIQELGRCVEGYVKAAPGTWDQFGEKRRQESHARNQHEELMAQAIATDSTMTLSTMMMLPDPVPNRPETLVAPEALVARAAAIRGGIAAHRDRQAVRDKRFEVPAQGSEISSQRSGRRGMLDREDELIAQAEVFAGAKKEDAWKQSV